MVLNTLLETTWFTGHGLQIERLRYQLGLVQRNEAFLLHAGDCAESFDACTHVSPRTSLPVSST